MLPPPAPTVSISRLGMRTGCPAIVRWAPITGRPSSTRATSVDVPPMSNVMMEPMPAAALTQAAPMTPALGPESSVRTGCSAAAATEMIPPFDWLTYGGCWTPRRATSSAKRWR